jgi:hypothetical protein
MIDTKTAVVNNPLYWYLEMISKVIMQRGSDMEDT